MEREILERFSAPQKTGTDEACAQQLLSQLPSPASVKDEDGRTLLHFACRNGWYDVVRALVEKYHSDPKCRAMDRSTPLHWACYDGDSVNIAKYLIEEQGCSVKARDEDGDTPLHDACGNGCIDTVKYLTAQKGCDPEVKNNEGQTPLSDASLCGRVDVVKYLVNEKNCNILNKDKGDWTPLDWANLDTLEFLFSRGIRDRPKLSEPIFEAYQAARQSHPLHATTIVFVMGNSSAGKSTLVKAIQNRLANTRLLGSLVDSFRKVSGVELHTAGIKPVHIHSKRCGSVILYDFAGQYEYYSSHAASLQSLLSAPEGMVLLVVDLSQRKEEIVRTLRYWGSFIANHCSGAGSKPEVAVIGSHADVVKKQGETGNVQLSMYVDCLQESLQIKASISIDCTQLASGELNRVCDVIREKSVQVRQQFQVNIETHLLFHLLLENCSDGAYTLSEVASKIPMDWMWTNKFTSHEANTTDLMSELRILSKKSKILFLENTAAVENSWVITKKQLLLAEVSGTIFAPENFVQHHDISNSTGVVPLSNIRNVFPQYDGEMIVSFLCHLQYCQEINESEAALIGQSGTTQSAPSAERFYFFPALVQEDRPTESCQTVAERRYRCGWVLQCRRAHQFLSPRFLHVLLLQVAFTFALHPEREDEDRACPVLQRKCNVWRSGIHWVDRDGVETVVEVVEQNTAVVVVMGCLEGCELACAKLRSKLIQLILDTQAKHSPAVVTSESLIHPSELATYPLKGMHELVCFSVCELAIVLAEGRKVLTHKLGTKFETITPSNLLTFEPLACLSPSILHNVFREESSATEVNPVSCSDTDTNCHQQMHLLESVLGVQSHAQPPTEKSVLERWQSKVSSATYGDLRAALEQFSVFRGKNLLVSRESACFLSLFVSVVLE